MEIYIVQTGDDIYSIADSHGVSVIRLIQDNGLVNPFNLAIGQAIIIAHPSQTHTVEEGDSLTSIANAYGVTEMQLLRNNSFLSDRANIYQGETLVISYSTIGKVSINGYAYPYINKTILIKTLPYLSYLSIFNYKIDEEAKIIIYNDDSEVIQIAKDYGVKPLMLLSSLSFQGEANIELDYILLLDKDYRNTLITNFMKILRITGYYGLNLMIENLKKSNQKFYIDLLSDISNALKSEGYLFFVTINPHLENTGDKASFEVVDYSAISPLVDAITFLQYVWGKYQGPPAPISSINSIRALIDYVLSTTSPEKIAVGKPLIAYDWVLPYNENSYAISLTLNAATILAYDVGAIIQLDEASQTPYFQYQTTFASEIVDHIVWFIDARSLDALYKLTAEKSLAGSGIWNIMVFYQQLWTLIASQYEIEKFLPES
jgi:spore germination protein